MVYPIPGLLGEEDLGGARGIHCLVPQPHHPRRSRIRERATFKAEIHPFFKDTLCTFQRAMSWGVPVRLYCTDIRGGLEKLEDCGSGAEFDLVG